MKRILLTALLIFWWAGPVFGEARQPWRVITPSADSTFGETVEEFRDLVEAGTPRLFDARDKNNNVQIEIVPELGTTTDIANLTANGTVSGTFNLLSFAEDSKTNDGTKNFSRHYPNTIIDITAAGVMNENGKIFVPVEVNSFVGVSAPSITLGMNSDGGVVNIYIRNVPK